MMTTKFHVARPHLGDKMYLPGDTREAKETDVKHLVEKGILLKEPPETKAEPAPANKSEPAPKNKGE